LMAHATSGSVSVQLITACDVLGGPLTQHTQATKVTAILAQPYAQRLLR
jgi:hypothetical protein